ncbi:MAG: SPFH domain-containing protein, partial [Ostreibacterium sp.]
MGIFNMFHGEFVDIIEWTQINSDTMVYRFPRYRNEIKYGAKLTVREGQTAIMVNEGKLADIFSPGIYELKTANLPILSTLQNWQHGFESPFKSEIYFFNTTDFLDLKWGTKQAITLADAKFGIVRLRAFGSFTMRIQNAEVFLKKLVGTDSNFEVSEVSDQLTNSIVTRFPEILAKSNINILELPTRYSELAEKVKQNVTPEFIQYGLQVGKIYIENISLPEAVQKAIDEKTGMNIIGDSMGKYTQYQASKGMANGEG